MKTYGIRTEIETVNNSTYTGYNRVYKRNGQEFPALRDLLGKMVTLRNGNKGYAIQSKNGIAIFVGQERINMVYGRRLTAYPINGKGNVSEFHKEEFDILSVHDADGNLFWERKDPVPKTEAYKLTEREATRLLKQIYGMEIEITANPTGGARGRQGKTLIVDIERESALRRNQETEQKSTVSGVTLDEKETETKTA